MSLGKELKAAFKKAATWGQAVAVGADDLLLITKEGITYSREQLTDDSAGQAFLQTSDQGLVTCAGDLTAYLRYQGLEVLLALCLGQAGAPARQGETAAYRHELRAAASAAGLFGTLVFHKGAGAHEYPSCKVDGFTLEGEAGQPVTAIFNLVCDQMVINTTGGVNPAAQVAALADPTPLNRVLFRQAEIRLNDFAGAALSASDAIAPNRFSLSFKRGQKGDHLAGGGDRIAEPLAEGFPEVSLTLEFPTYTSDIYLSALGSDLRKKASLVFTGASIAEGQNYRLEILLPHLALSNVEAAVDGAGKIKHPITATCLAAATPPAGMTGLTGPLALNLVNARASDPLV